MCVICIVYTPTVCYFVSFWAETSMEHVDAFVNVSRIDVLRNMPDPDFVSIRINDRSFMQKRKKRKVKAFVSVSARWRRKHFHRQDIQVGLWRGNGYMQAPVIGWARGWGAWTWLMRRCVLDVIRSPKEFLRMPGLRSKVESTAKDG